MHALDNVIWHALTTRQAHLGERAGSACTFQREVSMLGGLAEPSLDAYAALATLVAVGERVGLFLDDAIAAPGFEIASSIALLQMVHTGDDSPVAVGDGPRPAIVALGEADVPEMLALTELAKPGPFHRRTREMGDYVGIRRDGQLVAMAGERLRVPGYTELSAICTHPDHLGRGHAAALMAVLVARIVARGERPLLHVRPENTRAVALYERTGFAPRLRNQYVILQRVG